jgi:hypothetical protein
VLNEFPYDEEHTTDKVLRLYYNIRSAPIRLHSVFNHQTRPENGKGIRRAGLDPNAHTSTAADMRWNDIKVNWATALRTERRRSDRVCRVPLTLQHLAGLELRWGGGAASGQIKSILDSRFMPQTGHSSNEGRRFVKWAQLKPSGLLVN